MTKSEAGRLGGKKTLEVHGSSHMSEIGRRGAEVFHRRYRLEPKGTNDFYIVNRETGKRLS
ncbi:MAG: hypothetical protein LUQ37_10055, partial [Methanoregulaceae archaeon]|nr:hypothetical protein [Methanoregulaceae archaeon]